MGMNEGPGITEPGRDEDKIADLIAAGKVPDDDTLTQDEVPYMSQMTVPDSVIEANKANEVRNTLPPYDPDTGLSITEQNKHQFEAALADIKQMPIPRRDDIIAQAESLKGGNIVGAKQILLDAIHKQEKINELGDIRIDDPNLWY